jgi:hypothetical protein
MRTEGLARLLVLEKLPKPGDRDTYLRKRREERGRPPLSLYLRRRQGKELRGNIKDDWEDEVPEWQEEDQISDYHTFVCISTLLRSFASANTKIDNSLRPKI